IVGAILSQSISLGSLTFTHGDPTQVEWFVETLDGWDSSPASSLSLTQKLLAAGGWRSSDPQMVPRAVTLAGYVTAPTRGAVLAALDVLKSACSLSETPLVVAEPGYTTWTANVSRQGEVLARPVGATAYSFSVQLVAADSRKFGQATTLTTAPASSTGGLTVPFTVPFTIPAVQSSGIVNATNPGNVNGPVTVRITGPCVGPVVTHVDQFGNPDVFAMAGFNIGAGQWVDVDMEAQTVLAQGQAERSQSVTSAGFGVFEPGLNTWAFTVTSTTGTPTMSVTATPATG
ncbi:MAG: hypothetical protein ACXVX9_05645, partial [Mycobacteriaceae bacterium]